MYRIKYLSVSIVPMIFLGVSTGIDILVSNKKVVKKHVDFK